MVALHQGDADAIYALLDVPRNELKASVFEQADKLLKESTMPQTKGPNVNAHLNKTAIRDHIAKLKKEVRDSQTGDDTGPTAAQKTSYNTAWTKATDSTISEVEFAAYMHENRDALPLSGNGGYNWTELRNISKQFQDDANSDFDKILGEGKKVISAGLRPTPAEKMAAMGDGAASERLQRKEELANDLEARYGNELRGIRDDGENWKAQAQPFKPGNLYDTYIKEKRKYAKALFDTSFDEDGMVAERLYGPEAEAAAAAAVKAEEEAAAAEAEVARQEQEAAAEVVRLEEEAAEQKRQAKLREASIDDLRVLVETFLGENYTEENADIFHKAVLAIIEKKGIKVDPDILEGGDRNALKTWVTNVLREID